MVSWRRENDGARLCFALITAQEICFDALLPDQADEMAGGGSAIRTGATGCDARSRNSEYNFRRAQSEKPMSFARKSTVAIPELSRGYQTVNCDDAVATPFIKAGISRSGTTSADTKASPNHGMIWTKRIVFNVDWLAFFEFSPIHMPNQIKAARLAVAVSAPATDMANATKIFGAAKLIPLDTVTVPVPVVVVTVIAFVTITVLEVVVTPVAAGGVLAAMRFEVCC
jgi:hypothetical protein